MSTTDSDSMSIDSDRDTYKNTIKLISITPEPMLPDDENVVDSKVEHLVEITTNALMDITIENTVTVEHEEVQETKIDPIILTSRPALMSQFLIDILVKKDDIKSFADKITLKVSNKTLEILKNILAKAPEALDKVVDNIKDILSDGVIDHKDIPKMIILVTNLYKTDLKNLVKSKGMTTTEVVEFIQFILKLVIDLDFVDVNDKVQMFEIIEASGALLEMVIPPQEIRCPGFLSCFCVNKNNTQ
jgi:hypothetical protein